MPDFIAFDAASSAQAGSASSLSWSHSCSGSDRLLVVGTNSGDLSAGDRPVTSITYNGANLTKIRSDDAGNIRTELWYLVVPASGSHTIQVTFSGNNINVQAGAVSLTGVDQSSPLDANNGATGSSPSPSVSITTVADNAWVIDSLMVENTPSITVGAGQTSRWSEDNANSRGRGSTEGPRTPAGSVTMSWSLGSSQPWRISAASFTPSPVLTVSPLALDLTAALPASTPLHTARPPALSAGMKFPISTSMVTSKPPGLAATFSAPLPVAAITFVTRLKARMRDSRLIAAQIDTDFNLKHRETQIVVRSKRI
jgi:hypothetical protein